VSISAGTPVCGLLRERKPLVHQITNYVVMKETNAADCVGAAGVAVVRAAVDARAIDAAL